MLNRRWGALSALWLMCLGVIPALAQTPTWSNNTAVGAVSMSGALNTIKNSPSLVPHSTGLATIKLSGWQTTAAGQFPNNTAIVTSVYNSSGSLLHQYTQTITNAYTSSSNALNFSYTNISVPTLSNWYVTVSAQTFQSQAITTTYNGKFEIYY